MPANWPKNGLFLIRAENGKYWAETLPGLLEEDLANEQGELFAQYIVPALASLEQQISDSRRKELLEVCGKVIRGKAQTN